MKKIIYLLITLFVNVSIAQSKSGVVTYKVKKNEVEKSTEYTNDNNSKMIVLIEQELSQLEFQLSFNKNESVFEGIDELREDNKNYFKDIALLAARGNKLFYSNNLKEEIIESFNFIGETINIKKNYQDFVWTFLNETKKIENYNCFKAVCEVEVLTGSNNQKSKYKMTAWYCPELSFNFGPFESVGLPGLVLEFSTDRIIYYAQKIKFSDKDIVINPPQKGKSMTQEEYNTSAKKAFENSGH
ncbi:GLPGLI family protein [Mangrovimonas sp. YM274]|uniref:GLPGLI family protein n=1 Tax=Mangrovimonas sp. YM274 TaxID=3070660 RepID=UPI0027DAB8C7|nr:GLPGLI family protein [Mangrovimonas sp. YM274]WMI68830.1 GLPGLI family protein [Mangrovimonas sp. YM274]